MSGQVLPWAPWPQSLPPRSLPGLSLPMGTKTESTLLHPPPVGTWCFGLSRGSSEPLCWELKAGTGQAGPRGALLPAPTQLRTDLPPGHGLRQTGRPTWSGHAGHPCKHLEQGENIPISASPQLPASVRARTARVWAGFRLQVDMGGTEGDLPAQSDRGVTVPSRARRQRDAPSSGGAERQQRCEAVWG